MKNPGFFIELSDWKRFSTTTDQQGIAVINNLPTDTTESVSVHHDDFEMPIAGGERSVAVELKPGMAATVTVKMQKMGTEHLGVVRAEEEADQK